jgi:GxxExxY protein
MQPRLGKGSICVPPFAAQHWRTSMVCIPAGFPFAVFLSALGGLARDLYWIAMSENAVAQQIVDAAFRVHTTLGPGLLESVYAAALVYELEKRGLRITRQQSIPVVYEAVRIHTGFYADVVVEDLVIVEIKAVETVAPGTQEAASHLSEAG